MRMSPFYFYDNVRDLWLNWEKKWNKYMFNKKLRQLAPYFPFLKIFWTPNKVCSSKNFINNFSTKEFLANKFSIKKCLTNKISTNKFLKKKFKNFQRTRFRPTMLAKKFNPVNPKNVKKFS